MKELVKYKALLFDFDFTLGDSSVGICESFNYALAGANFPRATDKEICELIGLPLNRMFSQQTGSQDENIYMKFLDLFRERAKEVVVNSTTIYSGVADLLISLNDSKKQLGIVSTKNRTHLMGIRAP